MVRLSFNARDAFLETSWLDGDGVNKKVDLPFDKVYFSSCLMSSHHPYQVNMVREPV